MEFVDLHCHMLCGVDDGAKNEVEMYAMLDMAYSDGTRHICLTPHFHPSHAESDATRYDKVFQTLSDYAKAKYPALTLYRGNEALYPPHIVDELASGLCKTLGGSRYVLIEFWPNVDAFAMTTALRQLRHTGYIPIVAHAERYTCLYKQPKLAYTLANDYGVCFQINASTLRRNLWDHERRFAHKMIRQGLVVAISSDAHNTQDRQPILSLAYKRVAKKHGQTTAQQLFYQLPLDILQDKVLVLR